jgi:hypothetical protein
VLQSPAMSQGMPNIKVFPSFRDTAFFSGEEFSCTLTFKNVAEPSPSSSTASLGPVENMTSGSRIMHALQSGMDWMVDSGRSASEGLPAADVERPLHGRSMSTSSRNELHRSTSSQRIHGRSQSAILPPSPVPSEPPKSKQGAKPGGKGEGSLTYQV